jgi:hypothetical protein
MLMPIEGFKPKAGEWEILTRWESIFKDLLFGK